MPIAHKQSLMGQPPGRIPLLLLARVLYDGAFAHLGRGMTRPSVDRDRERDQGDWERRGEEVMEIRPDDRLTPPKTRTAIAVTDGSGLG